MTKQATRFKKELIWLDEAYESKEELFTKVGQKLFTLGYVKRSFAEALGEREKHFPTGLPTEPFHVAIPHTDTIHVKKEAIACIRLKKPVPFHNMGDVQSEVSAEFVFVLCILDSQGQVGILTSLIEALANPNTMNSLKNAQHPDEIYALFSKIA